MEWSSIQWDSLNALLDNPETPFVSIIKWNSIRQAFKSQQIKLLNYLASHISDVFDFAIATKVYNNDLYCNLNCLYFLTSPVPAFTSQLAVNSTFKQKLSSFIQNVIPNQPLEDKTDDEKKKENEQVNEKDNEQKNENPESSATSEDLVGEKQKLNLYNSQLTSYCRIFQFFAVSLFLK